MQTERQLTWDACLNVRDLGGHPTPEGETRWGAIVPSVAVLFVSACPVCRRNVSYPCDCAEVGAAPPAIVTASSEAVRTVVLLISGPLLFAARALGGLFGRRCIC